MREYFKNFKGDEEKEFVMKMLIKMLMMLIKMNMRSKILVKKEKDKIRVFLIIDQ